MHKLRKQIAVNVAAEFLNRSFAPGETIAILLRRQTPAETVQRIVTRDGALAYCGHTMPPCDGRYNGRDRYPLKP
jgi:hypothetical protein